jgi:hypothetical protein
MEHLFSPCTRLYDIQEIRRVALRYRPERNRPERNRPEDLQEQSLDVSTTEFLSAERAFSYSDLYAMFENENAVVWLTPHAAVMPENGNGFQNWRLLDRCCCHQFQVDGRKMRAVALSFEYLSEICDVVLRLLATSVVHSVLLENCYSDDLLINAPTLAHLMEQCQSLKVLKLENKVSRF